MKPSLITQSKMTQSKMITAKMTTADLITELLSRYDEVMIIGCKSNSQHMSGNLIDVHTKFSKPARMSSMLVTILTKLLANLRTRMSRVDGSMQKSGELANQQ